MLKQTQTRASPNPPKKPNQLNTHLELKERKMFIYEFMS